MIHNPIIGTLIVVCFQFLFIATLVFGAWTVEKEKYILAALTNVGAGLGWGFLLRYFFGG